MASNAALVNRFLGRLSGECMKKIQTMGPPEQGAIFALIHSWATSIKLFAIELIKGNENVWASFILAVLYCITMSIIMINYPETVENELNNSLMEVVCHGEYCEIIWK